MLGQCHVLSLLTLVYAIYVVGSHLVREQRLRRLSELNNRAYIDEIAPCLRQASLQFVLAQEHKG